MEKIIRKQVPTDDLPSECLVKSSGPRQSQLEHYRLSQTVTMKLSKRRTMPNDDDDEGLLSKGTLHHSRTLLMRGRHRPSSAVQSIDSRCQWQKRTASGPSPSVLKSLALLVFLLLLSQTVSFAYGKFLPVG